MPLDPNKFTRKTSEALGTAQAHARDLHHSQVTPEHLLAALVAQPESVVLPVLERIGVASRTVRDRVDDALSRIPKVYGDTAQQAQLSSAAYQVLEAADAERTSLGDDYLSTEHALLAMSEVAGGVGDLLRSLGVSHDAVLSALQEVRGSHRVTSENPEEQYQALEKYGRDLTEDARKGKLDPVIGRDEEIRRVIQVLSRRTKNNPVLIGEPGVGKTAIAEGLARRIVEGDVPESLRNKRLIALDIGAMVAGAKYRGEFEDRMKAVLKEIVNSNGEIVTFVDELHTIVGAGGAEGAVDVVERRIRQLEIEKAALAKETDEQSLQRLAALEEELAFLAEDRAAMVAHWQNEKDAIGEIRELKERLETARTEAEKAERDGD